VVSRIQAVRGMNDILPSQCASWRFVEQQFIQCMKSYAYKEIRLPFLESTQLYKRSIGEITDIVEKEMYTFNDLNGDSLSLRPEGTAGCVRACLEHSLLHHQQQKLWYHGPMFRHEKPQKGRYRQFYQFGVEVFGIPGIGIELELIALCRHFWRMLGIDEALSLQVNTLGTLAERKAYREQLIAYFEAHSDDLDEDSQRRLHKNPMRILDSKNPTMHQLIMEAPKLIDALSAESHELFARLCHGLQELEIPFTVNPFLVRGLDYYEHMVFEWVTDRLGSQATVCAGGRFDQLVEQLGGQKNSALGFALGEERLILLMESLEKEPVLDASPMFFMIAVGEDAMLSALALAESLRRDEPQWSVMVSTAGGSFKSQFKQADKSGARLALILGEDEMRERMISIKDLRQSKEQVTLPQHELTQSIKSYLQG
jgi:histidyl-tRNA synthetase